MKAFSLIYEDNSRYLMVKDILRQVLGKLTSNIEICAFDTAYQDKNREYQDSVLAMTRDDQPDAIAFYKSFFDTENEAMEDKGSILIHEIAHLIGLKSDKETKALKSAEALRNFLLLSTGKVTADDLFLTEAQAKEKEEAGEIPEKIPTRAGKHLYSPDQPRVPAGSSTGGQWTSDGSNSGSSKDDEESSSDSNDSSEDDNENSEGENAGDNSDNNAEDNKEEDNDENATEENPQEEYTSEEIKEEAKEVLEDMGKSDDEIAETLKDLTMEDVKRIAQEAKEIISQKLNDFTSKAKSALKTSLDKLLSILSPNDDTPKETDTKDTNDTNSTDSENVSSDSPTEDSSTSTGYKSDDFIMSSINNRTSNNDMAELEDCVKFESDNGVNGAWVAVAIPAEEGEIFLMETETQLFGMDIDNPDNFIELNNIVKEGTLFEAGAGENSIDRMASLLLTEGTTYNNPNDNSNNGSTINGVLLKVKISKVVAEKIKALDASNDLSIYKSDSDGTSKLSTDTEAAMTAYKAAHYNKNYNLTEGVIENYQEKKDEITKGSTEYYERTIFIDLDNKTVTVID